MPFLCFRATVCFDVTTCHGLFSGKISFANVTQNEGGGRGGMLGAMERRNGEAGGGEGKGRVSMGAHNSFTIMTYSLKIRE